MLESEREKEFKIKKQKYMSIDFKNDRSKKNMETNFILFTIKNMY